MNRDVLNTFHMEGTVLDIHTSEQSRPQKILVFKGTIYMCFTQMETFLILKGGVDCLGQQGTRCLCGWSPQA